MRKLIAAAFIIILTILVYSNIALAETKHTLYYKKNFCEISNPVLYIDGEYLLNIDEVSDTLDIKYNIMKNNSISIEFNGIFGNYLLRNENSDTSISSCEFLPYISGDNIYLSFDFFKSFYDFIIKYDKTSGSLFLVDKNELNNSSDTVFYNPYYNYKINLANNINIDIGDSDYNSSGFPVTLLYGTSDITTQLSCDKLNADSLMAVKDYYGDYDSPDDVIFNKTVNYKQSLLYAANDYYKIKYMYSSDNMDFQTNMKIINEYEQDIYGITSKVVLYNISKPSYGVLTEETHIAITIPVYANMCIYKIDFKISKGKLNDEIKQKITQTINSVHIEKVHPQYEKLDIFSDFASIKAANEGIYPDITTYDSNYSQYTDTQLGFSIKYPSALVPFFQNKITSSYLYKSYKFNNTTQLSISAKRINDTENILKQRLDVLKGAYKNVLILDTGDITLHDVPYSYISYRIYPNNIPTSITEYLAINRTLLIDIRLQTIQQKTPDSLSDIMNNVLSSLEFINAEDATASITGNPDSSDGSETYTNIEEPYTSLAKKGSDALNNYITLKYPLTGQNLLQSPNSGSVAGFSFSCPETWQIDKLSSDDVYYSLYEIKDPDLSSPVTVNIFDSQIPDTLNRNDVINTLCGVPDSLYTLVQLPSSYPAPYAASSKVKYLTSAKEERNDLVYIYKLFTYLDDVNRSRLCSTIDILSQDHIYSMLICANDYLTYEGEITNPSISEAVNKIYESFDIITGKDGNINADMKKLPFESFYKYLKSHFSTSEYSYLFYPQS